MASDLLHPGYRSLWFVTDENLREEYREKGMALIRRLMQRFSTNRSYDDDVNDKVLEIEDD